MSKAEVLRLRIDSNLKKEASEAAEAMVNSRTRANGVLTGANA